MIILILDFKNVDYQSIMHNTTLFREINNIPKINEYV